LVTKAEERLFPRFGQDLPDGNLLFVDPILCVAELMGWIGLIDPDDDGPLGLLGAGRGHSQE
jgi:hypothetical protein